MARLTDQVAVGMAGFQANEPPEVDQGVNCYESGNPNSIQAFGSGTDYYPTGDNYAFTWKASMLFVAPSTDNYSCGILVNPVDQDTTALAPTQGQTPPAADGTWLEVSSSPEFGAQQWWWPYQPNPPPGSPNCPTNDRDTTGLSTCVYIGGPNNPNNSIDYWLNPDGSSTNTWTASTDATVVDFTATGQNTICNTGTGACREIDDAPGDYSTIRSGLIIQQHYPPPAGFAEGAPCGAATVAYSEDGAGGVIGSAETLTFSRYQHHLPVCYHATVPVSQLCGGSRTFSMSLYTTLDSGPPIKLEEKNLNAINLERAQPTTVPNVIGPPPFTQAEAEAAIVAAGLTVSSATLCSEGPPPSGVVVNQNSPGGTVEPAGSPVQLTVSCLLVHP